ncbi:PEP/pyruvate-binding domain-containing protein [Pseudarthrobacter sulfonivorans]|uniref:PEP/pyruvate-binding domain-containing protein n=1 Tax=Pseudarthrobacter sulfonivorans TaxID=121292 RepID=UPI002104759D|nr:PEP/pyruvate-binding domain-containing protein [Pseudarthrobacter sulfonivorans]
MDAVSHVPERDDANTGLVVDLTQLASASLATVGGKALSLGRLAAADFPMPGGFCLTTAGYRKAAPAEMAAIAAQLDEAALGVAAGLPDEDRNALARRGREMMAAAPIPPDVGTAIRAAYAAMGGGSVAVRSSATAEDLPFASFAGQQDSFMDVAGGDAVVEAVRRCWASLWTDRAVAYRTTNGIAHREVSLAVVVQHMVRAAAAGVLFTANPVTGTRTETIIDASPGPGQAVVSGAVNPDHFVLETASGRMLQQPEGRAASLSGPQVRGLASLGDAAQQLLGAPQDVEWVIGPVGKAWLTQSRPITTLYPLPDDDPLGAQTGRDGATVAGSGADTRVYLCGTLLQGLTRPITPMGLSVLGRMRGSNSAWHYANPGLRMYVELTPLIRNKSGRKTLMKVLPLADGRSAAVFPALLDDPRFSIVARSRKTSGRKGHRSPTGTQARGAEATRSLGQLVGLIPAMVRALLTPGRELRRARRYQDRLAQKLVLPLPATAARRLQHTEDILVTSIDGLMQATLPAPSVGYLMLAAAQTGLREFLSKYGHRAVAEIDLGMPRWSEEPDHLLGMISNYLRVEDPGQAPDRQFARAADHAEARIRELAERAGTRNPLRGRLVSFCLRRTRQLAGLRELPKFYIVMVLAEMHRQLTEIGADLAGNGTIDAAGDVFFLDFDELRVGLRGADLKGIVSRRRQLYDVELRRRRVPRLLLSDGTDVEAAAMLQPDAGDHLTGTPASAGSATGNVRVIMDPVGAHLEPGDILVAPSTDPGWTPLFMTAGALVMEMGGVISHGAVVAREYGIPAVVGVADATTRLRDGQSVTVDGAAGTVTW